MSMGKTGKEETVLLEEPSVFTTLQMYKTNKKLAERRAEVCVLTVQPEQSYTNIFSE